MKVNYIKKFSVKNKKVFIVGGMGLIGKEVVNAFYQLGSKVVILDIEEKKREFKKIFKSKLLSYASFDCSDLNSISQNLKLISKNYGCPDVVVNCSYPKTDTWKNSSFKKINYQNYKENLEIHLSSYVWVSKYLADLMVNKKVKGSIIMLSSIFGKFGQDLSTYKNTKLSENMTYSIIKGGINTFTKQMGSFYGKNNIKVNSVSPGGIKGHVAGASKKQDKTFIKNYINKVPLGKMCKPEDVASTIVFLSSEASNYITGENIFVDGGLKSIR